MSLALRRHHKKRMKKRARKIHSDWYRGKKESQCEHSYNTYYSDWDPEYSADNLKLCSCYMCGNPRRYFGQRTRQELKSDLELKECLK